jgi:hypothetical protein
MLLDKGVHVVKTTDHKIGIGLYFEDPDGNRFEFFAETVTDDAEGQRGARRASRPQRADRPRAAVLTTPNRLPRRFPMPEANFGPYHIRKWFTQIEDVHANETGQTSKSAPLRRIVVAAAVHNPYAGQFVEDLSGVIDPSDKLGAEFGRRVVLAADGTAIVSYGKACVVGVAGEYEHGNAFLTQVFADPVRDSIGGAKSWVPSTGKVGAAGAVIDIPLAHKDALYVRSHYDTISVTFGDAPRPDEVVIAFGFATGGRLHARLGGITAGEIRGDDGLH